MEDTLLGIARLVGPIKSVGRSNVSIGHFPPLISDPGLKKETEHLVENAKSLGKFAVDWRHRYIAHQDLELALGRSATPLSEVTRERIEKALSALSSVLNYVAVAFGDSETAYSAGIALGDAKELLYVIRDGLAHRSEKEERLKRCEPNSSDLKPEESI
jgi:AbiU2